MMSGNVTPEQVRSKYESIDRREERLARELNKLQALCNHPNLEKTYKSDTGNYDPSADSYWTEHRCPDCRARWNEEQ